MIVTSLSPEVSLMNSCWESAGHFRQTASTDTHTHHRSYRKRPIATVYIRVTVIIVALQFFPVEAAERLSLYGGSR